VLDKYENGWQRFVDNEDASGIALNVMSAQSEHDNNSSNDNNNNNNNNSSMTTRQPLPPISSGRVDANLAQGMAVGMI
jgi:hypothetical protein